MPCHSCYKQYLILFVSCLNFTSFSLCLVINVIINFSSVCLCLVMNYISFCLCLVINFPSLCLCIVKNTTLLPATQDTDVFEMTVIVQARALLQQTDKKYVVTCNFTAILVGTAGTGPTNINR